MPWSYTSSKNLLFFRSSTPVCAISVEVCFCFECSCKVPSHNDGICTSPKSLRSVPTILYTAIRNNTNICIANFWQNRVVEIIFALWLYTIISVISAFYNFSNLPPIVTCWVVCSTRRTSSNSYTNIDWAFQMVKFFYYVKNSKICMNIPNHNIVNLGNVFDTPNRFANSFMHVPICHVNKPVCDSCFSEHFYSFKII